MTRKWHSHLNTGVERERGRESRCLSSEQSKRERDRETLSLYQCTPVFEVVCHLKFNHFLMQDFIPSEFATLYTHYNAFNFLSISKKKQMNQKKQKKNFFFWNRSFAVFNPACVKNRINLIFGRKKKRDSQKFQLVFCMCVCASLHTKKLLQERERKKF